MTAIGAVVAFSAAALPLVWAAGIDGFRLPKELVFRAEAILIVAIAATALLLSGRAAAASLRLKSSVAMLVAAIVVWSSVTTWLSTNRLLSVPALLYTATALTVFVGTYAASRDRSLSWILVPVSIAAVPNAILAILQATSIWNPFVTDPHLSAHLRTTAFLGNPNDVGSYLMPVVILMVAGGVATKRALWWIVAAVAALGVLASGALTATIALAVSLAVMSLLGFGRKGWIGAALLAFLAVLAVLTLPMFQDRAQNIRKAWREADYPLLTSGRIFSIGAGWAMFKDHPLTGVGPGAFKYHYLQYRKAFDEQHPWWYLQRGEAVNFGEVHCDHVQILAEEGAPGYLLFAASLVVLASASFRRAGSSTSERSQFVRVGAMPFAAGFAVLSLAAFPLELAAVTQVVLHGAAAMLSWRDEER